MLAWCLPEREGYLAGYRAFFSYARADDKLANWLHRQIDSYRTPKALVGADGKLGPVPPKLHPIFRDRTDLGAGDHIASELQQALEDSECLVVLCSPASAKSYWVNHECETFLKLGREARIFPVIAAGDPDSGDQDTECFPPALQGKGLLAADLREIKKPSGQLVGDGREVGRLKLIAGLLGLSLDTLAQRERRRQRMLLAAFGAAAIVFAGVATVAVSQSLVATLERARAEAGEALAEQNAREAARERDAAIAARELAEQNRQLADRNAEEARIQEIAATANALEATLQRNSARQALARIFSQRAWQAVEAGDLALATRYALSGWRSAPENQAEYRSVLARILHEMDRSSLLRGHETRISSDAFSPDGMRLVTASGDATARIWDVDSGREIVVLRGHDGEIASAAFSPDGNRVVTSSRDSSARIWDANNGRQIAILRGHSGWLSIAAFSPDGTRVVTASSDGTARVWDSATGRELSATRRTDGGIRAAAFSPASDRIVTVEYHANVRIRDAASGREIAHLAGRLNDPLSFMRSHSDRVGGAEFSPDGTRVLTYSDDGTARLWDSASGAHILALNAGGRLQAASFSPVGDRIVVASDDGTASVWDAESGQQISALDGHEGPVRHAGFSADGHLIITGSDDGTSRIWDASSGNLIDILRGHEVPVTVAVLGPGGARALTASADGVARVWEVGSVRARLVIDGDEDLVTGAAYDPNGGRIITTSVDPTVRIWSADSGEEIGALIGDRHTVLGASFSADGARVVTNSVNGNVRIWDAASGSQISSLPVAARGIALNHDGSRVFATTDRGVTIWDVRSGRELGEVRIARAEQIALSPDGTRMAVTIREAQSPMTFDSAGGGYERSLLGHTHQVASVAFSHNGMRIVTTSQDQTARIWDAVTGAELMVLRGHEAAVVGAVFSSDGTRVVTASWDGTARVWDPTTGRELAAFQHEQEVVSAVFSPHGAEIMTASPDGARIWNASRLTQPIAELARSACSTVLGARGRRFSSREVQADPLIREVWMQGRSEDRDVCELV